MRVLPHKCETSTNERLKKTSSQESIMALIYRWQCIRQLSIQTRRQISVHQIKTSLLVMTISSRYLIFSNTAHRHPCAHAAPLRWHLYSLYYTRSICYICLYLCYNRFSRLMEPWSYNLFLAVGVEWKLTSRAQLSVPASCWAKWANLDLRCAP